MKRFACLALLAATSVPAFAADVDAAKLSETCAACHGPGGAKPIAPDYPVIAGQYANYLAKALHEYKEGKRKNPIMGAQAAQLSDEQIRAITEYFEAQPSPLYTPTEAGDTRK